MFKRKPAQNVKPIKEFENADRDTQLYESAENRILYLECAFAKLVEILKSRNLIDSTFCFLTHEQRLEECEKIIDEYVN